MKVLFIGGTGLISTAVTQKAIERGIDLYVMNRGQRQKDLPSSVHHIISDINDTKQVKEILKDHYFDVVVE
jgi:nucleoside-diphosphate-sugar epimerase